MADSPVLRVGAGRERPCPACRKVNSAFYAGHVAIFSNRFHYFCDEDCREYFLEHPIPEPEIRRTPTEVFEAEMAAEMGPARNSAPSTPEELASPQLPDVTPQPTPDPSPLQVQTRRSGEQDGFRSSASYPPQVFEEPPPSMLGVGDESGADVDTLLLGMAGVAGSLTVALTLLGGSVSVTRARVAIVAVGCIALVSRFLTRNNDASDARPATLLAGSVLASGLAIVTHLRHETLAAEITSTAGVIVAVAAILFALRKRANADDESERQWIHQALSLPARRVVRGELTILRPEELRVGEEVQVETGEIVPADMTITRGRAEVLPWLGMTVPVHKREGDSMPAGARVVEGAVRGIANSTGADRAWYRLLFDERRRLDVHGKLCKNARLVAELGSLASAGLVALAKFALNRTWTEIALSAIAAHAALATTTVASVAALHVLRGLLLAARRGISYKSPEAWDKASRVSMTVFSARGTLLLGEPDVVEIEPTGKYSVDQVLAWTSGAEAGQNHPIARAIQRALEHRSLESDAVRSTNVLPGFGVTAVTSTGEQLLIGNRGLMLQECVSIALAEDRLSELEGLGRTVLLVSVAGKLAGLVALQDGLRPGARASIQHLLDVDVEPVLLSGDSRETCETLARALDIDHVRPEVLPAERANEINSLSDAGAKVAAVGLPIADAAILAAADVSVALSSPNTGNGGMLGESSVILASDDVRDASLAIALAHRARQDTKTSQILAIAPGVVGALAISFAELPPVYAPLAALVGGAITMLHVRTLSSGVGARAREGIVGVEPSGMQRDHVSSGL
jgi:P-type Cu+ transporter